MKVKVTVELDIPDTSGPWEMAQVIQDVFDNFVNHAKTSHLEEAIEWVTESKGDEFSPAYQIYKHHRAWADIFSKAESTMRVERID